MPLACGERLANAGYAVFGVDYEGHGRSEGVRCLITKFDNVVSDCEDFFKSICGRHSSSYFASNNLSIKHFECSYVNLLTHSDTLELRQYKGKSKFLFGDSMGGAVCLLLHKKDLSFWDGAVLVAPMCKV